MLSFEYRDFVIKLEATETAGEALARVEHLSSGPVQERIRLPFHGAELDQLLRRLEAGGRGRKPAHRQPDRSPSSAAPERERWVEEAGEALFESLFAGSILERFEEALAQIDGDGLGLRVRIALDPSRPGFAGLAVVPWEILRRGAQRQDLAKCAQFGVVREIATPHAPSAVAGRLALRVLVVMCQPDGCDRLDLLQEWRTQQGQWIRSPRFLEVRALEPPVTLDRLQKRLGAAKQPFDVLHFMGHGDLRGGREGVLLFEDGDRGRDDVTGEDLARVLTSVPRAPSIVVLNACNSGSLPRQEGLDPFAGVSTALLLAGTRIVVANQFSITDLAALLFSEAFYHQLAARKPLEVAVTQGRMAIAGVERMTGGFEWATPVVYLGTPRDAPTIGWPPPSEGEPPPRPIGIRTFVHPFADLGDKAEDNLDLVDRFEPPRHRHLKPGESWDKDILPAAQKFLVNRLKGRSAVRLYLDLHHSVGFAAGAVLGTKGGIEVTLHQRSPWGAEDWLLREDPDEEVDPSALWRFESKPLAGGGPDLVVAASVTHDVLPDVTCYLEKGEPATSSAGRLLVAEVPPFPRNTSVRNGSHVVRLAQALAARIRSEGRGAGTIHLFAAAPLSLLFALGQLAPTLDPVTVYEYDYEAKELGAYSPGGTVPPR